MTPEQKANRVITKAQEGSDPLGANQQVAKFIAKLLTENKRLKKKVNKLKAKVGSAKKPEGICICSMNERCPICT